MDTNVEARRLTYQKAVELARKNGEEAVPAICGMCGPKSACRVYAFKKGGKMVRVMGMAEGGTNRGAVCGKSVAAPEWEHSPDRLTTPLLRVGEKGEGKFVPISWDEAIKRIADKLIEQKQKYGAESLAILSPGARNYKDISLRFLAVHGSPNHAHSGICFMQRDFAFRYTLGASPKCDCDHADLIVHWGNQPIYSGPATESARELIAAKKRKARIITVKPSLEPDGGMADMWLPVRPGTDAALVLSVLNVVIEEELIDREFVDKWCYGFDRLKEHIKRYPPLWGEKISGVPAEQIRAFARIYATTKAACIDLGNGLEHAPSSNDAVRGISILMAITGHLDRPGCNVFPDAASAPKPNSIRLDRYSEDMISKLVAPEFPMAFQPFTEGPSCIYYKAIESVLTGKPYPIRCLIAAGTQPAVSNRGTKNVIEALKKVDFFVTLDVMKTAEMAYADIVVPTTTTYESDHPFEIQGNKVIPRMKVVDPPGDFKSTHEFFLDLAVAMGYGDDFFHGSIEELENYRLAPLGLTVDDLRANPMGIELACGDKSEKYEKYEEVFASISPRLSKAPYLPQGKVAIYNTEFEAAGYSPLPEWREPPESLTNTPELTDKYPLILSDYHTTKVYSASWLRNVPSLRQTDPWPTMHINPDTAGVRGIKSGDWVRIESPHGWIKAKAELYPGIRPDTVMVPHGWWQGCSELGMDDAPLADGGYNVNSLYSVSDDAFDPLVTAPSSQTLVEVSRIEE